MKTMSLSLCDPGTFFATNSFQLHYILECQVFETKAECKVGKLWNLLLICSSIILAW